MNNTKAILVLIAVVAVIAAFAILGITNVVTGGVVASTIVGALATMVAAFTDKVSAGSSQPKDSMLP